MNSLTNYVASIHRFFILILSMLKFWIEYLMIGKNFETRNSISQSEKLRSRLISKTLEQFVRNRQYIDSKENRNDLKNISFC